MSQKRESFISEDIHALYKRAQIIFDYSSSDRDITKEPMLDMNGFFKSMKLAIDTTYKRNDHRGMRMIVSDYKEMFDGLKNKDKELINEQFKENGLSAWDD